MPLMLPLLYSIYVNFNYVNSSHSSSYAFNYVTHHLTQHTCQKYQCTYKSFYQIQGSFTAEHIDFEREHVIFLRCLYY